jgi:hypothetical protein
MKFINLTRHTEIGANSYYLEAGGKRLILDSGMHPKEVGEKRSQTGSQSKAERSTQFLLAMPIRITSGRFLS